MPIEKAELRGDPNVGMYVAASETLSAVPLNAPDSVEDAVSGALDVDVVRTTMGGSNLIGALCGLNSNGAVVTRFASEDELEPLRETGLDVEVVPTNLSASGNIVLANDRAALVHPELEDQHVDEIGEVLDVPVETGTVGPYKTVGSAAAVTNGGMLLPNTVPDREAEELAEFFDAPARVGSVNYGVKMVGTGLLANSKGFVAGTDTSGPEMGRIEEALFP